LPLLLLLLLLLLGAAGGCAVVVSADAGSAEWHIWHRVRLLGLTNVQISHTRPLPAMELLTPATVRGTTDDEDAGAASAPRSV